MVFFKAAKIDIYSIDDLFIRPEFVSSNDVFSLPLIVSKVLNNIQMLSLVTNLLLKLVTTNTQIEFRARMFFFFCFVVSKRS